MVAVVLQIDGVALPSLLDDGNCVAFGEKVAIRSHDSNSATFGAARKQAKLI